MARNQLKAEKSKDSIDLAQSNKANLLRLKRADGHLRKVMEMLQEGRPCGEVLQQLSAVISALGASRTQILKTHLNTCLRAALKGGHGDLIQEIEDVIARATKV